MNIRPISASLQQTAITKLNEDPSRIKDDIEYIKDWLKKQPHLNIRLEDQWILAFLRGSKFSLERAKKKIDSFYTFRTLAPEILRNRNVNHPFFKQVFDGGYGYVLPVDENNSGPVVFLTKCDGLGRTEENIILLIKLVFMSLDILLNENDRAVIEGVVSLVDVKNITMGDLTILSPSIVRKTAKLFNHGYPLRTAAVHFINTPQNFVTMFNFIKKITHPKIRERLHVHPNLESLHEYIPKSTLPTEYEGTAGPEKHLADNWKRKMKSYASWMIEDEKYCSIEKLRPGKPKTSEELFGVTGSFRQLNVD